jgi:hypothetical protein
METVHVPNPLPAPIPGGGPQTGYQFVFNKRYYKTRALALKPFSYGLAASEFPDAMALRAGELTALADRLFQDKEDFDQQCDYWIQDPYATMFERSQIYGYDRVPVGTGNLGTATVVTLADLQGPPVKGKYLLVTCDINKL